MKQPWQFSDQAETLVAQMSIEAKASLMSGSSFWDLQPIEEFGLGKVMVSDGPHGLRKQGAKSDHMGLSAAVPATCFPTAVTLASSWDRALISEVGAAIGRECMAESVSVLLAPGVNIKRSPLCGRNFEYYSEDPFQAGEMASAFVGGVQSTGVGTSLKHFAVNNQEAQRMVVDTLVDARSLFEIYLPAFEATVKQVQPWTLMCAYNRFNGVYCSENETLLTDILRDRWGFKGLVVTDWGAVNDRVRGVAAGLELEMPSTGGVNDRKVAAAVHEGQLDAAHLDRAAMRVTELILAAQNNATAVKVDFKAHHTLARKAAAEGAVLLKNEANMLPLSSSDSVALIGAFAETPRYQGAGSSQVNATQIDTPLALWREKLGEKNVSYAQGFDGELATQDTALIEQAVAQAKQAKVAIVMAGLPPLFEAEGFDREHLRQPAQIESLIEAVAAANPNTVVVLSNGAPIEMPWMEATPAVLEIYLAGQAGAGALLDLLYGEVNPSGKLAETFPLHLADSPSQQNFATHPRQLVYREGLNVGYRHFTSHDVPVLFPFGHGLSYTQFTYSEAQVRAPWSQDSEQMSVSVKVTNSGTRAGAEVVQVYVRDEESTVYRPDRELKAFEKISLQAGETQELTFTLERRAFAYFDVDLDDFDIEPGAFDILFAASANDVRQTLQVDLPAGSQRNSKPLAEAPYVVMSDAQLSALGVRVPKPDPIKPYHANSTLADIRYHWLGKRVAAAAMDMASAALGQGKDTPVAVKMREEMIMSMRLITVSNMSAGALAGKRFELLLLALNNRWLRLLWRLPRA
ncbi:MAG: glycosyl hydrolase [Rhodobiaceae bacterium]|nr:glycosyl hydrolase [Rhodobiaceae bacterium]